jgi:hypothetical protein
MKKLLNQNFNQDVDLQATSPCWGGGGGGAGAGCLQAQIKMRSSNDLSRLCHYTAKYCQLLPPLAYSYILAYYCAYYLPLTNKQ